MALGGFVSEAFGGGAFVVLLQKAWEMGKKLIKSQIGDKVQKEIIDKVINTKSFEDENYFARDLMEASLEPDQKRVLREGIIYSEELDKNSGAKTTQNFRAIVTFNDKDHDNTVRPGVNIIEEIGTMCKTKEDVVVFIQVIGAMHDPLMTSERVLHFGKTILWPFLKKKATGMATSIDNAKTDVEDILQARMDEFESRPWWKKLLFN